MAWEHLEQRLSDILKIQITFPSGVVSLPADDMTLDEWLTSLAQTDEELRELSIPRMQFLQNRWRVEQLLKITWENPPDLRSIWSMYVGERAYMFLYDGSQYHVIASILPGTSKALFRTVIGELLQNKNVIPEHPAVVHNYHPDFVPEAVNRITSESADNETAAAAIRSTKGRTSYLTELLFGWIARWMHQPEHAFWHEEGLPASIGRSAKTADEQIAVAGEPRKQPDRRRAS